MHTQCASLGQLLQWPRITVVVEKDVLTQLYQNVSLNDNGGIFHDFKTESKQVHALLHNSGTNALQALFYACQFAPGDEVSLALHARSPLRYEYSSCISPDHIPGIYFPRDMLPRNAFRDPTDLLRRIGRWEYISCHDKAGHHSAYEGSGHHTYVGLPCNIPEITSILKTMPYILLLEDCSHASRYIFSHNLH